MIERYSGEAEEFISEATLEFYLNGAGLKENVELAAIYERHGGLFERETVRSVLAAAPAPPPGGPKPGRESPADRAARGLAEFAALEYLGNQLRELTEQITNAETKATVTWDDKPVPFRYASVVLVNEPTAERRHELERRILAVTAEQNPTRVERIRRQHAAPADLGVCVLSPEPASLADAYSMVKVLFEHGLKRVDVAVNMASDDDDGKSAFDRLQALVVKFLDKRVRMLGILPYDRDVPKLMRRQKLLLLEKPGAGLSLRISAMARTLLGMPPSAAKRPFFARLFGKKE